MKRILFIAALFSLPYNGVFAQASNQQPIVPVNGIAIVVNDEVITKQELQERVRTIEQRLKAQGVAVPPRFELQKQIIERLIVDRAQLQLARETGLRVDDVMLDRAIARIAEQNKMTLHTFRSQLEKDGMSYAQFRESLREDILTQRLLDREIDSKIQVTEPEIDNYLLTQNAGTQKNKEIELVQAHVRHILIKITPTVTKQQATHKLLGFKQQLQKGGDFDDLAKQPSKDSIASKVEDLGWVHPGDIPVFDPIISKLKEGQISEPIETSEGMHLIQLVEMKKEEISPARKRLLARDVIHARKLEEAKLEWVHQLRDNAYVEIRDQ